MLLSRDFPSALVRVLQAGLAGFLLICLTITLLGGDPAWAANRVSRLPQGNAITDGKAILRYALPIDNETVRELQADLEDIADQLRAKRWGSVQRDLSRAARLVSDRSNALLQSVSDAKQVEAKALISQIQSKISEIQAAAEAQDKELTWETRRSALLLVGQLEELMVDGFPFEIPEEFDDLPRLLGRATVEMKTDRGTMRIVLDGYSAPITAGNFADLAQRGFYDGLPIIRAEEFYVVQSGDPEGPAEGFIDPKTGAYRAIPMEILVQGDDSPIYGYTLEDVGRYREQPVLPFSAYGALALARPSDDPNGGSSQFFFLRFEPELTPAGLNLLDGRYAVFGYLVEGEETLDKLKQGDRILSVKVIEGANNLVNPTA